MKEYDCYQLGKVIKPHGLKGDVSVYLDVDFPDSYKDLESVFLKKEGRLVPFFIANMLINGPKAVVRFEDVNSVEVAERLMKLELFLPLTYLPSLPEGKFYFHDLVGCSVLEDEKILGKVTGIYDLGHNNLLAIISKGKEILIPLTDAILLEVDTTSKVIEVSLPKGLLDLYDEPA